MADVFLSYARQDRVRIAKLAERLEAAGHTLWWDRQIDGGSHFSADIEREIKAARVVVVAWSKHAVTSHWVRDEAGVAFEADKLVAVSLDGTAPPMGFRQIHAIDMRSGEGEADLFRSLTNKLGRDTTGPGGGGRSGQAKSVRPVLVAVAILLALVGAGAWAWQYRADNPAGAEMAETAAGKSIAILPFRDLSAEDQQWFSDGLAQEIASALSRTPDLQVAPSAASFRFRDRAQSIGEMGAELGVAYILDGSVRRAEDRIVVDIELIEVASGEQTYTQRYDRPLADTITVQEDIATRIANALDTALDPEALAELVDIGTNSVEAYEEWLRAIDALKTSRLDEPLVHLERALEYDPQWSWVHSNTADLLMKMMNSAMIADSAERARISERTRHHLDRAAALARTDEQRDMAAFAMHNFKGEYRAVVAVLRRMTRNYPEPWQFQTIAHYQLKLGERGRAIETMDSLLERDPESQRNALLFFTRAGAHGKALEIFDRLSDELREDWTFQHYAYRSLLAVGRIEEAKRLLARIEASPMDEAHKAMARFFGACSVGDHAAAAAQLPGLKDNALFEAHALHLLGRNKDALAVQKRYDFADPPYPLLDQLAKTRLDPARLPNFRRLIEREQVALEQVPDLVDKSCPA